MEFEARIKTDGTIVTDVKDRQGQDCNNIKRITQLMGKELSDERTGPDCDTVHETTGGGSTT
jgi:hypothetical protein